MIDSADRKESWSAVRNSIAQILILIVFKRYYKEVKLNPQNYHSKMPPIQGKYQHYKNENIDDYFSAVGVPFMGRKMMSMSSPLMEINVDGEQMTIKNSSLLRTVEYTFKIGEEYEEKMPNTSIKSITTIENDNEVVTNSIIPQTQEKCGRHYLFTDDECIVTLTHEKAKTPGKRYFRRLKE
ncbi:unnamed protein product, partial [Iphiclides podalirius]